MINLSLLKSELRSNPDVYGALSDADAAGAVVWTQKTPKSGRITSATVASAWGDAAFVFRARLRGAIAAKNGLAPLADYALGVLDGTGFDPSDPVSQAAVAAFVSSGLCTQEQADQVVFDISQPFGGVGAEADITEARRQIAAEVEAMAFYQPFVDRWNAFAAAFDQYRLSGWDPAMKPADL